MSVIWPAKKPVEAFPVEFADPNGALDEGETFVDFELTVSVTNGLDPAPEDVLNGDAIVEPTRVLQPIHDGLDGVVYLFEGVVTTSANRILAFCPASMPVQAVSCDCDCDTD